MAAPTMPVSSCPALRRDSCFLGGAHSVASGGTEHKLTHSPPSSAASHSPWHTLAAQQVFSSK